MSGDVTDSLPPDGPYDTAPILEQIVAELRGLREEVRSLHEDSRATRTAVEDLGRDIREELAGTREVFRTELGLEGRNVRAVLADLERQPTP